MVNSDVYLCIVLLNPKINQDFSGSTHRFQSDKSFSLKFGEKNHYLSDEYVCFLIRSDHCVFMDSADNIIMFLIPGKKPKTIFMNINT